MLVNRNMKKSQSLTTLKFQLVTFQKNVANARKLNESLNVTSNVFSASRSSLSAETSQILSSSSSNHIQTYREQHLEFQPQEFNNPKKQNKVPKRLQWQHNTDSSLVHRVSEASGGMHNGSNKVVTRTNSEETLNSQSQQNYAWNKVCTQERYASNKVQNLHHLRCQNKGKILIPYIKYTYFARGELKDGINTRMFTRLDDKFLRNEIGFIKFKPCNEHFLESKLSKCSYFSKFYPNYLIH